MRQRLQQWGARLHIAATAQGEAELTMDMPLDAQEAAQA
jgi:hypothetical protein